MTPVYVDDGDGLYEPGTDDALLAEYEYDGANRRIEKEVSEAGGGPTHTHYHRSFAKSIFTDLLYTCFMGCLAQLS